MLSIGIVGLANVGKSSLFKALTRERVEIANYPFTTIDPHKGVVKVPDARLEKLATLSKSAKIIPAAVEFVDIAGLVKGAHEGAGLGNQFLNNIRETDAIAEVIRAFHAPDVVHSEGEPDPVHDIKLIQTELALADLAMTEKMLEKAQSEARSNDKKAILRYEALKKTKMMLENNERIALDAISDEEREAIKDIWFLTSKPLMAILNVDETALKNEAELQKLAENIVKNTQVGIAGKDVLTISIKLEAELAEMTPEEAGTYKQELSIKEDALERVIRRGYELLGLITFFTTGEDETRAWQIPAGSTAPRAGRAIHTDFEEKFIRAEVIACDELLKIGTFSEARAKGKLRTEGRDYVVKDGDVIEFKI